MIKIVLEFINDKKLQKKIAKNCKEDFEYQGIKN